MAGIKDPFRRLTGHREMPGEPIVDSVHRLVLAGERGGRSVFDELAGALLAVVSDADLAEQVLDVLTEADPKVWIELDAVLRSWRYGYRDPRIAPSRVIGKADDPLAVMLAACDRSGYERERALGHPIMRTDVRLFPVLVVRTVDWVGAVRDRALQILEEALSNADAAALQAVVPVAVRLGERQRGHSLTELVRHALVRAGDETLSTVRRSEDLRTRRFAFEVTLQAGRMDREQLLEAALHEPDVISRTRCARALSAEAIADDRPEIMQRLLEGTSARVRVEALTALVRLGHTDAGPRFLADDASLMRLTAQWAVRRAGGDPAEHYRRHLSAPAVHGTRGLLAGLGDCGGPADADLVLPHLRDPRPRVRAEAVRTLRRLGARIDVTAMLEDPAPAVVRSVVTTLRASGPDAPVERLWELLDAGHPRHVRQAAHRLLADRNAWTRIRADLLLAGDVDEVLSRRARADLAVWCARDAVRVYQKCPDELRGELEGLLSAAGEAVDQDDARLLRWLIQTGR
ncbi:HEAT repeat domain-containing protein [Planobispora siamensis]|uniref:HEAT repeat-containing protein n=1 Tax=Planobispora siamensis TaxID=936338 RepID=A0A8J3SQ91_9ACTN|nr:HEAT repeat domain-containing protein [Planobispora siamensis]GIH96786.1 hypothetical protein Psi01_74160 [Planobispora siamensis]